VVTGLYRYVRNPIYVAVVAIILGQAVLMGDWRLVVYGAPFHHDRARYHALPAGGARVTNDCGVVRLARA
jgi:hypothetical protein